MEAPPILPVVQLPDTFVIPGVQLAGCVSPVDAHVVVGLQCGQAVLRGADVFAPGLLSMPRGMLCTCVLEISLHYLL